MNESAGNQDHFMKLALQLAASSRPSPNPRVGAIIVKNGEIVGQGFHRMAGEPHAEIHAIMQAGECARGADLYVTLEPCCHFGRTGPCTDAIIRAGLKNVFVGMTDPDSHVSGRGNQLLTESGIHVIAGVQENACRSLLAGYIHHRLHGRPLVTLKAAITLDGFVATRSGDSMWISCEQSRRLVHEMRAWHDAVLVGVQTVLSDNPQLTVRDSDGQTPLRIVLDSSLRTPPGSRLFHDAADHPVLMTFVNAPPDRIQQFETIRGVSVLQVPGDDNGQVSISHLLAMLGDKGILAVMVEGGGRVHGAFIRAGMANRFSLFIAPKMLGDGIPWAPFPGVRNISEAVNARSLQVNMSGVDIHLTGEF